MFVNYQLPVKSIFLVCYTENVCTVQTLDCQYLYEIIYFLFVTLKMCVQ